MAVIKGTNSLVLSRRQRRYDPATRTTWVDEIYTGSNAAVNGGFLRMQGNGSQVDAQLDEGHGTLIISRPKNVSNEFVPDRYEIISEFVEKEIWSSPSIIAEAEAFNATVTTGERNYRKLAEDTAEEVDPVSVQAGTYPLFAAVVRHLRNGVTGWEKEYLVMRRSRKVLRGSNAGQASVGDGLSVYSTAQLKLPADVEFSVPDSSVLTASSADYFWGWRRRPSTSVIEGLWVEQTSEFILSEWSTLHYTQSTVDASW